MAKDGPSQPEVDSAISNIAGSYAMRFQAAADVGAALIAAELHGFGSEYLTNFPLVVGKIDAAAARRASSEILDPKDYVVVMVGDAKDLEPQLKKEGWRYEKVAFTDPITPEVKVPDAPVDPKALAQAKKLVVDAIAAKGGKRLAALKGFRMTATGTTKVQGQTIPVDIQRVFIVPDKMRIDATLAKQLQVIVAVDGKVGWQQQPDPKTGQSTIVDLGAQDLVAIDFERWREPELILEKATDPQAKLAPAPDETIDGKPQDVLRLGTPIGVDLMLYLDKKTHLLTRMTYTDGGQSQTDDFGDYRDVSGIKIAFKRKSSTHDRVTELELGKVDIDPKLDASEFAKPK
jgi:hypothetical protein